jgi:hypothetical protein
MTVACSLLLFNYFEIRKTCWKCAGCKVLTPSLFGSFFAMIKYFAGCPILGNTLHVSTNFSKTPLVRFQEYLFSEQTQIRFEHFHCECPQNRKCLSMINCCQFSLAKSIHLNGADDRVFSSPDHNHRLYYLTHRHWSSVKIFLVYLDMWMHFK